MDSDIYIKLVKSAMLFNLLLLLSHVSHISSSGILAIEFIKYEDDYECDNKTECDFFFYIDVDIVTEHYWKTRTYHETNIVVFGGTMLEVEIPTNITDTVNITWEVWDDDCTYNFDDDSLCSYTDDKVRTMYNIILENLYGMEAGGAWVQLNTSFEGGTLDLQYMLDSCDTHFIGKGCNYCEPDYYTSQCTVSCVAQSDIQANYTCGPTTGGRVCGYGRKGDQCDQCDTHYYTDTCTTYCVPQPSQYTCNTTTGDKICLTHYYTHDCDVFCQANENYTCDSVSGEEICIGNRDGFNCSACERHWYGANCETYCKDDIHYTCGDYGDKMCSGNRTGTECDICLPHHFGVECDINCVPSNIYYCHSNGTRYCRENRSGAHCTCLNHWYGPNCNVYCESYSSSTHVCVNNGTKICIGNREGANCSQCSTDYYTDNCDIFCHANENYTCDSASGEKICIGNRNGCNCSACEKHWYGANCDTYCKDDYRYTCDDYGNRVCTHNHYGDACNITCYSVTDRAVCSDNGTKTCLHNFAGEHCSDCNYGYQGDECDVCVICKENGTEDEPQYAGVRRSKNVVKGPVLIIILLSIVLVILIIGIVMQHYRKQIERQLRSSVRFYNERMTPHDDPHIELDWTKQDSAGEGVGNPGFEPDNTHPEASVI